jgi:non-specific serine/threonine protein kinase/serine/threonine-protein kinase
VAAPGAVVNPERWQQIKDIVADALAVPPPDRAVFLARACAGDPDALAEASSLLAADDPAGAFLEIDRPPDRIGVYRIIREIGRGGMGSVYLGARADGQFEQQVAVKIVKRGMDSAAVLQRFASERQILARLQHRHIARLFDGGMTPDGRPYFVMEYLEAEPIVEYCETRRLGVPERIDLMRTVCDAVDYAHRHLVLHRDLKSENILVDASGDAKLVDFGIAKVLATDDAAGQATEIGLRVLTPRSSSPEQIRGEPLTTASDIYALGLLMYELACGRAPYDVPVSTPFEQARVISEARPRRPSDAAPPDRAGRIRGDLDTVILKALEKSPADRYVSAADMAEDLRRVRESRPIHARPASIGYRVRKYATRHWRALAVAAAVAAVVSWAVGDALVQGRRAERHFQDLRTLANSFVFEFHDAIAKLPGSTPARELVVSRALQYLDGLSREAAGDLDLKKELAESYLRVGDVQGLYYESNLGKTADARASYEKARTLFADVVAARPSDEQAGRLPGDVETAPGEYVPGDGSSARPRAPRRSPQRHVCAGSCRGGGSAEIR